MLSVISAVLAVCIVIIAVFSVSKRREDETAPSQAAEQTTFEGQTTVQPSVQPSSQPSSQQGEQSSTTAAAPSSELSQLILGKWMDSANMSGYEFKENGKVTVTYVNLTVPVIEFPINGSADGSYTLNGNQLTVNFSIYKKTITREYTISVNSNTISMTNKEDGKTSTYEKVSSESSASSGSSSSSQTSSGIYGSWQNADATVKYTFNETGIVNLEFSSATVLGQKFTGECDGVFILSGDKLTIQYSVLGRQLTDEFTYSVSDNSMSLKDKNGDTTVFIRSTSAATGNSSLVGKWSDSSNMSGYEFKDNGDVEITYVNFTVPVINMPINGSFKGTYTVNGNQLTITSSIYSKTITKNYLFSITGNTLTLTDKEDGAVSTYSR